MSNSNSLPNQYLGDLNLTVIATSQEFTDRKKWIIGMNNLSPMGGHFSTPRKSIPVYPSMFPLKGICTM